MTDARILIVEDEPVTAMALQSSLEQFGYEIVASVPTGEEAVAIARKGHVDVVLMDIRLMGKMDGVTAAETIQKEMKIPSIYLTAYSDEETLRRAKIAEPDGYLVKPYNERELHAAVEISLHSSAVERDRRSAKEAADAREKTLQEIVDNSPAIIYIKDAQGRYTLVNRKFESAFATTRDAARGRHDHEVLPADIKDALRAGDQRVLREGKPIGEEQDIIRPDGVRSFVATRFPLRTSDGVVQGVCGVLADITDLKATSKALKACEARYRLLAENSEDLITLATLDGRLRYASPSSQEILDLTPADLIGTSVIDLVHPDDRERVHDELRRSATNAAASSLTFRLKNRTDEQIWVEAKIQTVATDDDASTRLVLTVMRDVSERKRMEAEIQKLDLDLERRVAERTRALVEVNERLEAFNRMVSHDLRAQARGIGQLAMILAEDHAARFSPDEGEIVTQIVLHSRRLDQLMRDLTSFAEGGRAAIERQLIDMTALARDVVADLMRKDPERTVEVDIADGLTASGDEMLLRIVLENLIGNAWKYTTKETRAKIEVGSKVQPDGVTGFFVKDNGAGFDPSGAAKLFQPFQRLHDRAQFPGTGLGLSSVRRIVERHGGLVWAEGQINEGATFWFTLSAVPAPLSLTGGMA